MFGFAAGSVAAISSASNARAPARSSAASSAGSGRAAGGSSGGGGDEYAWERAYERTWEVVEEDESGMLRTDGLDRARRAARRDAVSAARAAHVQRGMLRHLFLVIDMTKSMAENDLKPSRAVAVGRVAQEFVAEFFDQNPISSLGVIICARGGAKKLTSLSPNRDRHVRAIAGACAAAPEGDFSLQTALELALRQLQLIPAYGTREVLLVHGAHASVDPGNVAGTIAEAAKARVAVSVVSLPGEVYIGTKAARETGGRYGVPEHYEALRGLLLAHCVPPPRMRSAAAGGGSSSEHEEADAARMVPMGFPRLLRDIPIPTPSGSSIGAGGGAGAASSSSAGALGSPTGSGTSGAEAGLGLGLCLGVGLCACHGQVRSEAYACPRCAARVCDLPSSCPVCGLQLISAARLARSYKHLFPVLPFVEVPDAGSPAVLAPKDLRRYLPPSDADGDEGEGNGDADGAGSGAGRGRGRGDAAKRARRSDNDGEADGGEGAGAGVEALVSDDSAACTGCTAALPRREVRFVCLSCRGAFCAPCDVLIHETLHNCPGCC